MGRYPVQGSCTPETWAALNLAVRASGAVTDLRVTPLISSADAVGVFAQAATVGYQPPG